MIKTPEDVAKEFRRRYRRDPDPASWDLAIEWRLIGDVIDDPAELDSVLERIRRLEGLGRRSPGVPSELRRELEPDRRATALARIRAVEASHDPLVEAFRAECLDGQLLEPGRIPQWIEERRMEQGEPARYVRRWETEDGNRVAPSSLAACGFETRRQFGEMSTGVYLEFPGGSVQVSPDSTLGRLKFVSTALRLSQRWREEEAVGFVLSGATPSPFLGRVTNHLRPKPPRITIEVDPRLSGSEVLRLYQWARDRETARARTLSELHAELAVFAAERNDGREWKRVLAEWNQTHPSRPYPELGNFIRDCRKAYERITGEALAWRRPRGAAGHRQRRRTRR